METTFKLQEILATKFGSDLLHYEESDGIPTITISSSSLLPVINYLYKEGEYTFLTDLCGIHFPEQELPLGIIYHLHNFKSNNRIRVKSFVSLDKPEIPSITGIYSGANWMERETYDFYGIIFTSHPNLKRILNVEYLDYFPMRKEYPLEDPTREDKDDGYFGRK
jgi:NADH-quinone oxidoreductase subunit C